MTACPTDEDLAGHLAGELDPRRSGEIAGHLDGCAACRAIVVGAVRGGLVSWPAVMEVTLTARGARARPAASAVLDPGTVLGKYRIASLLGAGGMGVVYVARDTALDRDVALKVLRPDLSGDPAVLAERLVRESRLMAKASHPAVITVFDVGRDGDQVYVAMELIHGETLGTWLRRGGRRVDEVVALFRRAGAGLAAAHRAGLVHRDFKPDNVLVELRPGGGDRGADVTRVLVTDFGVARALAGDEIGARGSRPTLATPELTATGVAVGTPAYMAPEQLVGEPVDERADVFGFAVAVWEALFGVRPFVGATPGELRAAMARPPAPPEPRPPSAAHGRVPAWLVKALLAALVADPAARTPTMTAALAALDPAPRARRRRRLVTALAALVLAAGATATALAWPRATGGANACATDRAGLVRGWSPVRSQEAAAALAARGADPTRLAAGIAKLDHHAQAWLDVHRQVCGRPATDVIACLTARRLELTAIGRELADATAAGVAFPDQLAELVSDPRACLDQAAALADANVPADPVLARTVAELRRRMFAVEVARDGGDYAGALAALPELEAAGAQIGWDRVFAEVLYLSGSTQSVGGDTQRGVETLRRAAVIAQRTRYDTIAANVWIVLAHTTALDLHDSGRALEYLDYAQPAVERLGKPPDLAAQLVYTRGVIEVDMADYDHGEAHLREALAIAEPGAPAFVDTALQGLAYVLESRGRFADAAAQYQRALDLEIAANGPGHPNEVIYRERLAYNLAQTGAVDEGVRQARQALAVAEATLDEKQIDRMHAHMGLAEVLRLAGRPAEALAEVDVALPMARAIVGDKSQIFGEVQDERGELLLDLDRPREALATLQAACAILDYTAEGKLAGALCWADAARAQLALGQARAALARLVGVLPTIEAEDDAEHIQLASVQIVEGDALLALGRAGEAATRYETARATFAQGQADRGFEASAEFGLARAIVRRDRAKAVALARAAVARWEGANGLWTSARAAAAAWLAARGQTPNGLP